MTALHLGATLYMTGLIWFVQVVHYPLMGRVGRDGFREYEQAHTRLTTWVVAPPMLIELATGIAWAFQAPGRASFIGLALIGVIWVSTALFQIPAHRRLERGFDASAHRRLVTSNWLRTVAWSARAILVTLTL